MLGKISSHLGALFLISKIKIIISTFKRYFKTYTEHAIQHCFPEKKITVAIITLAYDCYGLVDTNLFVVQSLGCVWLWNPMPGFPAFTISLSLLKLMSIESMMPFNHLILCLPLLLLPSVFHSIRVFSSESSLRIGWPKYWSFSISPSNEWLVCLGLTGLISLQ